MDRLRPYLEKSPERLMKFYHIVGLILTELPEGEQFRITDRCQPQSVDLFRDLAILCMHEEHFCPERGDLEMLGDLNTIRRNRRIRIPRPQRAKTFIEILNEIKYEDKQD